MSKKQNEINAFHSNSKIENKNKDEKNKKQVSLMFTKLKLHFKHLKILRNIFKIFLQTIFCL